MGVDGSVCDFWESGSLSVFDGEVKRKGCGHVGYGGWISLICAVMAKRAIHCDAALADDGPLLALLTWATCFEGKGAAAWVIWCMRYRASYWALRCRDFEIGCVCDMEILSRLCSASYHCFFDGHCFDFFHGRFSRTHPDHFDGARQLGRLDPKGDCVGLSRRDYIEAWQSDSTVGKLNS